MSEGVGLVRVGRYIGVRKELLNRGKEEEDEVRTVEGDIYHTTQYKRQKWK